jgi:hypothetical protein
MVPDETLAGAWKHVRLHGTWCQGCVLRVVCGVNGDETLAGAGKDVGVHQRMSKKCCSTGAAS